MYAPSFALQDHVRLHDCLCAPAARDSHIVLSYNSHPDILELFTPDFYIVALTAPTHGPAGGRQVPRAAHDQL